MTPPRDDDDDNNNNSARDDIDDAVIMAQPLWEFTRFVSRTLPDRQVATSPKTKPTNLGCESPV